jgi:N-hydroxyarylamine O-acetyltransferase
MSAEFDADAYCMRIGYRGPRSATLQVLRDIHALHPAAITFENLDVLLKRPIRLELDALVDKMVRRGRGGYCFEQNTLFMTALQVLGFAVRSVAARVQWNAGGRVSARNHMSLLVSMPEGEYLADVGFGGLTMTAPLRLEPDTEQPTAHGLYRLVRVAEEFQLQARVDGEWAPMYQFSLADETPADWEVANWFISTAPASIFTHTLLLARPTAGCRYALRNNRLRLHRVDGTTEERIIKSAEELTGVLRYEFNLTLPPPDELAGIMAVAGV